MEFYKKVLEPFVAVAVLIMVVILVGKLRTYNNLQEEIAVNCGWAEEQARCYCEKSSVIAWENEMKNGVVDIDLNGVDLAYSPHTP